MTPSTTILINLLGYITGAALYSMLLVMVLRAARFSYRSGDKLKKISLPANRLLLLTAALGLSWNIGALLIYTLPRLSLDLSFSYLVATIYTTLGLLPAVVVDSVLSTAMANHRNSRWLTFTAYSLSVIASLMHFYCAVTGEEVPSHYALHILTIGFGLLIVILLFLTRHEQSWRRALWVVALSVFALSALHLSHHVEGSYPWWVEVTGHQASLPLVLAILYQDYRFALADIFLKRALALLLLVGLAFTLYVNIVAPFLVMRGVNGEIDPRAIGLLLALWVMTALGYPLLWRAICWFVDSIILRRANYDELRAEIARSIALHETPDLILDEICQHLGPAFNAKSIRWIKAESESDHSDLPSVVTFTIAVPTTELPHYQLQIGELLGGRQLLSDDIALLDAVVLLCARRIDAVRVVHDRCAISLREQEISKLATEAELRALRAQINPHFLFNALTTIGYLIQTAPDRAFETLMRLTGLLRGVLRRSAGEFTNLGDEIDLIRSYLDIECARFEERLKVRIDVPNHLYKFRIPSLLLQPLVENAIKHGISPIKNGGEVSVRAELLAVDHNDCPRDNQHTNDQHENSETERIILVVQDTGAGASESQFTAGRRKGVGLANVERRIKCHFGDDGQLIIKSTPGQGTIIEIRIPVPESSQPPSTLNKTENDSSAWRQQNYVS